MIRWLGLVVGVIGLAVALSGVVSVWTPALDRIAAPSRYRVSGDVRLAIDAYIAAARSAIGPDQRIARVVLQRGSTPVIAIVDSPHGPAERLVFLDPPTAKVLGKSVRDAGLGGWLKALHERLLLGVPGQGMVGATALALLTIGLIAPWRRPSRPARATTRDRTLVAIWYSRVAFWSLPLVLVMTLTGIALAFPGLFAMVRGDAVAPASAGGTRPVARERVPADQAVMSARRWSRGRLVSVDWPGEHAPDWTILFDGPAPNVIKVADDSARAIAAPARDTPTGLSWVQRLHTGRDMPWWWKPVASVAGLAAAMLAMVGLIRPAIRPVRRPRGQTRSTRSKSVASRPKRAI